jgi:hypothetical protein
MTYEIALIALADPARRAVPERLRAGAASVGDIGRAKHLSDGMARGPYVVCQRSESEKRPAVMQVSQLALDVRLG